MASSTLNLFRLLIPEFDSETDDLVTDMLTFAAGKISGDAFGQYYGEATVYLAAHLLKKRKESSSALSGFLGGISSDRIKKVKEDILEVEVTPLANKANISDSRNPDLDLKTTSYGIRYIALRDSVIISVNIVP